jgi:hypothetical protein
LSKELEKIPLSRHGYMLGDDGIEIIMGKGCEAVE